jgi:hypothetical protein
MFFNLTTNEHHPLLGTVRAIFGLREVGLETEDFILVFASDDVDTLLCLGLHSVNTRACIQVGGVCQGTEQNQTRNSVL